MEYHATPDRLRRPASSLRTIVCPAMRSVKYVETAGLDAYIIIFGVLGLIVLYPYGNLRAIDAYFFGVSASTESGLNTVDVKELKIYQQLFIYFVPIVTNLGFINILVVIVRLHWFEKRLKEIAPTAHSSTEAKYIATLEIVKQVLAP